MMKTEPVPATESASDKIATYYVIPVVPGEGSTENVLYYEELSKADKWKDVSPKNLNAKGQGHNADKIRLLQPTTATIIARTGLPVEILDQTANLYAGVARTLAVSEELPGVYPLGTDGALTIPVTVGTVRGLILVFTQAPASGVLPRPVTQLIASTDPEIKNSTGCD